MPAKIGVSIPLILKDRLILREGRWNGVFYPAEEIKPLVSVLNNIVKAVQDAERDGRDVEAVKLRNATSLFWDHDERCENWLGDVRNFRWDDKVRGLRGDLYIVDKEAASKLKYQEARGWTSWGLSPSVLVDKIRNAARNISFNNIAVVLEPAGGTKLMLSATTGPREGSSGHGGDQMGKKKEDLKKDEKKDEITEEAEDKTKEETSEEKGAEEDSTKEKETPSDDASSEEEELEDIDFDAAEEDSDSEEQLQASTDDIMAAVEKVAKLVGALLVAMKKGAGYGEPAAEEEEKKDMSEALKSLDRDAMLDLAAKITKEAKALENESELTETVLREFLSRISSLLPGSEEMAADGSDDEDAKKEDGDKESEEKEEGEEAESDKDTEDSKSEKKEDMTALVKEGFADIRENLEKKVQGMVKKELSLRVKPTRKGRINREAEELSRKNKAREDLQAKLDAEPDLEKKLVISIEAALGVEGE